MHHKQISADNNVRWLCHGCPLSATSWWSCYSTKVPVWHAGSIEAEVPQQLAAARQAHKHQHAALQQAQKEETITLQQQSQTDSKLKDMQHEVEKLELRVVELAQDLVQQHATDIAALNKKHKDQLAQQETAVISMLEHLAANAAQAKNVQANLSSDIDCLAKQLDAARSENQQQQQQHEQHVAQLKRDYEQKVTELDEKLLVSLRIQAELHSTLEGERALRQHELNRTDATLK